MEYAVNYIFAKVRIRNEENISYHAGIQVCLSAVKISKINRMNQTYIIFCLFFTKVYMSFYHYFDFVQTVMMEACS